MAVDMAAMAVAMVAVMVAAITGGEDEELLLKGSYKNRRRDFFQRVRTLTLVCSLLLKPQMELYIQV